MRSSAAASTTGWNTPSASVNWPSCAAKCHRPAPNWPNRWPILSAVAESVEWARALVALDTLQLDPEVIADTAGILFKQREDVAALTPLVPQLLAPETD